MVELVAPTKREYLEAQLTLLKNEYFGRTRLLMQQLEAEIAKETPPIEGGTP